MPKINRERAIALGMFGALLTSCILVPAWALSSRSGAAQELADEEDVLARLQAAHSNLHGKAGAALHNAPETAFLQAQTSGLAGAELQTYLSQSLQQQHASLLSSGVQQAGRSDSADVVRIQATLEIGYEPLQELLYHIETGTPYVFVDSLFLQIPAAAGSYEAPPEKMKVTLNLRALWHQPH